MYASQDKRMFVQVEKDEKYYKKERILYSVGNNHHFTASEIQRMNQVWLWSFSIPV
jgi:hypothetical protein